MSKGKFIYGKIIHLILESGRIFESKEALDEYIKKHYNPTNEYLRLKNKENLLNTVWKMINTNRPINYYHFVANLIRKGYRIFIERPILTIRISSKAKNYSYHKDIPDIVLYEPNKKKVVVIEIKSGTRRRKKSYIRQVLRYKNALEKLFKTDKIEAYIYYFKYDKFEKIESEDKSYSSNLK